MRLTTRLYDDWMMKEAGAPIGYPAGPGGGTAGGPSAADEIAGAYAQTSLADYLSTFQNKTGREWRGKNIWIDICIRYRMDRLREQELIVGPVDSKKPWDQALATEIYDLLQAPSAELESNTFAGLWGPTMEDVYTTSKGFQQALLNKNLTPYAFRILDANRMSQNPAWKPRQTGKYDVPSADDQTKRWIFTESDSTKIWLSSPEVVVTSPYMNSHDRTGLSPIKALYQILVAEMDTRRNMHGTQKYRIPPGVFVMPGAAPGTPERMRVMWDLRMAGRFSPAFMNLPKDSKWVEFGGINLLAQGTFQFYEILVKATAAAFGTTPFFLGWTEQDSRANANTQMVIADRGEAAMLKLIREVVNTTIVRRYKDAYGKRAENLWATFKSLAEEDELEDAQSLRTKAGPIGFISINEVRSKAGLREYTKDDLSPEVWPFVSEPWVPSALQGILLPLKYAAMSFGITPGQNEALIAALLLNQRTRQPLESLPEGDDTSDIIDGEVVGIGDKIIRIDDLRTSVDSLKNMLLSA